jgi:hypothetical protein
VIAKILALQATGRPSQILAAMAGFLLYVNQNHVYLHLHAAKSKMHDELRGIGKLGGLNLHHAII